MKIEVDHIALDFDGVIKDTLEKKGEAFYIAFREFGEKIALDAQKLHLDNIGKTREWKINKLFEDENLGVEKREAVTKRLDYELSKSTINSPWVNGARELLNECKKRNIKVSIITAMPKKDIIPLFVGIVLRLIGSQSSWAKEIP